MVSLVTLQLRTEVNFPYPVLQEKPVGSNKTDNQTCTGTHNNTVQREQ